MAEAYGAIPVTPDRHGGEEHPVVITESPSFQDRVRMFGGAKPSPSRRRAPSPMRQVPPSPMRHVPPSPRGLSPMPRHPKPQLYCSSSNNKRMPSPSRTPLTTLDSASDVNTHRQSPAFVISPGGQSRTERESNNRRSYDHLLEVSKMTDHPAEEASDGNSNIHDIGSHRPVNPRIVSPVARRPWDSHQNVTKGVPPTKPDTGSRQIHKTYDEGQSYHQQEQLPPTSTQSTHRRHRHSRSWSPALVPADVLSEKLPPPQRAPSPVRRSRSRSRSDGKHNIARKRSASPVVNMARSDQDGGRATDDDVVKDAASTVSSTRTPSLPATPRGRQRESHYNLLQPYNKVPSGPETTTSTPKHTRSPSLPSMRRGREPKDHYNLPQPHSKAPIGSVGVDKASPASFNSATAPMRRSPSPVPRESKGRHNLARRRRSASPSITKAHSQTQTELQPDRIGPTTSTRQIKRPESPINGLAVKNIDVMYKPDSVSSSSRSSPTESTAASNPADALNQPHQNEPSAFRAIDTEEVNEMSANHQKPLEHAIVPTPSRRRHKSPPPARFDPQGKEEDPLVESTPAASTMVDVLESNASTPEQQKMAIECLPPSPKADPNLTETRIPQSHVDIINQVFGDDCDLYRDVLLVDSKRASDRQIRVAYFRRGREVLANAQGDKKRFSGLTASSKAKFHAISLAYEIVNRPEWRKSYDIHGWDQSKVEASDDVVARPPIPHYLQMPKVEASSADLTPNAIGTAKSSVVPDSILRPGARSRGLRRSDSSSNNNIRWSEEVEELVYRRDPEEDREKNAAARMARQSKRDFEHDALAKMHEMEKNRKKSSKKKKVFIDVTQQMKDMERRAFKNTFMDLFLHDIDKSLDGLEDKLDMSFGNDSEMGHASNSARSDEGSISEDRSSAAEDSSAVDTDDNDTGDTDSDRAQDTDDYDTGSDRAQDTDEYDTDPAGGADTDDGDSTTLEGETDEEIDTSMFGFLLGQSSHTSSKQSKEKPDIPTEISATISDDVVSAPKISSTPSRPEKPNPYPYCAETLDSLPIEADETPVLERRSPKVHSANTSVGVFAKSSRSTNNSDHPISPTRREVESVDLEAYSPRIDDDDHGTLKATQSVPSSTFSEKNHGNARNNILSANVEELSLPNISHDRNTGDVEKLDYENEDSDGLIPGEGDTPSEEKPTRQRRRIKDFIPKLPKSSYANRSIKKTPLAEKQDEYFDPFDDVEFDNEPRNNPASLKSTPVRTKPNQRRMEFMKKKKMGQMAPAKFERVASSSESVAESLSTGLNSIKDEQSEFNNSVGYQMVNSSNDTELMNNCTPCAHFATNFNTEPSGSLRKSYSVDAGEMRKSYSEDTGGISSSGASRSTRRTRDLNTSEFTEGASMLDDDAASSLGASVSEQDKDFFSDLANYFGRVSEDFNIFGSQVTESASKMSKMITDTFALPEDNVDQVLQTIGYGMKDQRADEVERSNTM